jgi:hypothetical protein
MRKGFARFSLSLPKSHLAFTDVCRQVAGKRRTRRIGAAKQHEAQVRLPGFTAM